MSYVPLDLGDLALAAILLLANGAISLLFGLGLARTMATAALRMVLQLAVVALALKFIFEVDSPLWTALFALIMLAAVAYEVTARQERPLRGYAALAIGAGPPFLAGIATTLFAAGAIIAADPWYAPRYVLPILGMMLGNALSGTSLVLDAMTQGALRERAAIEARVALGATRFEALHGVLRRALVTGLMPILTAMAATGIVSLPGMMTGQILAGVGPVSAAKYQIMIMLLIAGATGLSVFLAGIGAVLLLTDERHRLRLDRIHAEPLRLRWSSLKTLWPGKRG